MLVSAVKSHAYIGSGTGLGLATARRIVVDRHSGSLSVQSAPGSTTFLVRLALP
jgi:signal transduction histidine kinase